MLMVLTTQWEAVGNRSAAEPDNVAIGDFGVRLPKGWVAGGNRSAAEPDNAAIGNFGVWYSKLLPDTSAGYLFNRRHLVSPLSRIEQNRPSNERKVRK